MQIRYHAGLLCLVFLFFKGQIVHVSFLFNSRAAAGEAAEQVDIGLTDVGLHTLLWSAVLTRVHQLNTCVHEVAFTPHILTF